MSRSAPVGLSLRLYFVCVGFTLGGFTTNTPISVGPNIDLLQGYSLHICIQYVSVVHFLVLGYFRYLSVSSYILGVLGGITAFSHFMMTWQAVFQRSVSGCQGICVLRRGPYPLPSDRFIIHHLWLMLFFVW